MSIALTVFIKIAVTILQLIVSFHPELKTNPIVAAILADIATLHASAAPS